MAGRTPKNRGDLMDDELRIRMTAAQRQAMDAAAKAKGLETSTWARAELIALAKKANAKKQ